MNQSDRLLESMSPPGARGRALVALLVAGSIAAALVSLSRWSADPRRWLYSYLVALIFAITISLGALAFLMLQHLTRAVWSIVLRRILENLTRPLPFLVLAFLPVALHLPLIYTWADPAAAAADPALARKAAWLNPTFFNIRSAHLPGGVGRAGHISGADVGAAGSDGRSAVERPDAGDQ